MPGILLMCAIAAVILSALFTGAELAIAPISRDSIERLVELRNPGAAQMLAMIRNKRRFLLMIMMGRIMTMTVGAAAFIGFALVRFPISLPAGLLGGIIAAILTFVISETFFAQVISTGDYERRVARFAYPLYFFHILFYPFTAILDNLLKTEELADQEEAFIEMVKSQSESGVIREEEGEMIQSIFEFADTTVREVMVPRIDIIAADKNVSVDDLLLLFQEQKHSRIPIYEEHIDHIIGFVYAKDLLTEMAQKGKDNIVLKDILREPYFVPENKKISEILKEFKQAKVHIAIVIDEYGGTAGLVALEDVIEEIVGEIQDEYDIEEEHDYVKVNENSYLMDGGLDIDDVNEILRSDIPTRDYDTLGGFLYHRLGFIPQGGEVVNWDHYTFTIREIIGNRISKVLVVIHETVGKREENGNENE